MNYYLANDVKCNLLPEGRPTSPFHLANNVNIQNETNYDLRTSTTTGTGAMQILPLLLEMGTFSGHPYQIDLNYRTIDTTFYHSAITTTTGTNPPMLRTLVDQSVRHTQITPISLFFHEIKRMDKEKTPSRVDCQLQSSMVCKFGNKSLRSKLSSTEAVTLSKDGFERLLNFFGFTWDAQDKKTCNAIGPEHITSFIEQLNATTNGHSLNIGTHGGFSDFLKRFHLQYLFQQDRSKCITWNIRLFGMLLRYVCSVRVASFEGQHRFNLISMFLQGYLSPTDEVPLRKYTLSSWPGVPGAKNPGSESDRGYPPKEQFQNAQCFQQMTIRVGTPVTFGQIDNDREEEKKEEGRPYDQTPVEVLYDALPILKTYSEMIAKSQVSYFPDSSFTIPES